MFGNPGWSKDYDPYRDKKWMKRIDIAAGFLFSAGLWYWLFDPIWYVAPATIALVSTVGFIFRFERRYLLYGAMACVFFPLLVIGSLVVLKEGANE